MLKFIQKIPGIILCSILLLLLLVVNVFAKQKKQPKLEDVRQGKSLGNAIESSPIESFEILVNHKAHYPVKMYNGRSAEILYKTEDNTYWGFPNAGFFTTYVYKLYYCESSILNKLIEQFPDFSLRKSGNMISGWFAENVKEPDAEHGMVSGYGKANVEIKGDVYLLRVEGTYFFYNEEIVEQKKNGKIQTYFKKIPIAQYKYRAYFNNSGNIQNVAFEKAVLDTAG